MSREKEGTPDAKISSFDIPEGSRARWITTFDKPFYPDYLDERIALHKPTWREFRELVEESDSSAGLYRNIQKKKGKARIQLCRFFRKFVSPETNVERLKVKKHTDANIKNFGHKFRDIDEVKEAVAERPDEDTPLFAILGEYDNRGESGYKQTEAFFDWFENTFEDDPDLTISGPRRAGQDIILSDVLEDYESDTPADFVIKHKSAIIAVGLARYDTDRGGAQESDRPGNYRDVAARITAYEGAGGTPLKVVFLNDGLGLLSGKMWSQYVQLEKIDPERIKVCTHKMLDQRITRDWLLDR